MTAPDLSRNQLPQGPRCQEPDCTDQTVARGRCSRHYRRFIRDGGLGTSCALPHCDGGVWAKGLCAPHHGRSVRYGLSIEDLLILDARSHCDICPNVPEVVDHDHLTGAVRGVLCRPCNLGLGYFRDDPARLISAITFLSNPPGASS